jgi:tetratricopeptide (TPR) repeat protein
MLIVSFVLLSGLLVGTIALVVVLAGPRTRSPIAEKTTPADTAPAEAERQQLQSMKAELEATRRELQREKWLTRAQNAFNAQKYADAEEAFEQVLKLDPINAEALKGIAEARVRGEQAARSDAELAKRRQQREQRVADAQKASAAGQRAEAVRLLEEAHQLDPSEASLREALADARAALEADNAQKKIAKDYRVRLDAGKNALEAGRFAEAAREFTAAAVLMPEAVEAREGQRAAEAKLAAQADREKNEQAAQAALTQARAALDATRYNEAIAQLEQALRLLPGDREATRLLAQARQTRDKVKAGNAKRLAAANNAVTAGQLEEAVRLANDAVGLWAEDEAARKALRRAETLLETTRTNQDAYLRFVNTAALAMADRRYTDAVAAYTEALRLNPNSVEIAAQLRNARIAAEALARARVEYERLIRLGNLALSRNVFADAIQAFREAEKLLPGDLAARDGILRAQYLQAMLTGQTALRSGNKAEALQAFEAALAVRPGDPAAQRGLLQARLLR